MEEINKEIGLDTLLRNAGGAGAAGGRLTPEEKREEITEKETHVD
jgi:hypothetical protein